MALTSRNLLLPARRAIASRRPDRLKANGGGSNAILVRAARILEHRTRRLTWWPERRVVHGVRLPGGWVVNLHASTHPHERRRADLELAFATAREWAGDAPLVFGGDLNALRPGFPGLLHVARHHVDHLFARGWTPAGRWDRLDASVLSDHEPLRVALRQERPRANYVDGSRAVRG